MSTIASHSPLNITETVRDAWFQRTTSRKWQYATVGYASDSLASYLKFDICPLRFIFSIISSFRCIKMQSNEFIKRTLGSSFSLSLIECAYRMLSCQKVNVSKPFPILTEVLMG